MVRGVGVPDVVRLVALAEVAAEADRGGEEAVGGERAEEIGGELGARALAEAPVPAAVARPASIAPRVREGVEAGVVVTPRRYGIPADGQVAAAPHGRARHAVRFGC